ncbi:hypothetical protein WJX72_002503 [[Myrmecia] bisecta]|uniref:Rieske domain-containing protein n=1 Tax=[Myrmecia] bisecta TaxID=41462 RepID=A0AAW1PXU0_9CHLO
MMDVIKSGTSQTVTSDLQYSACAGPGKMTAASQPAQCSTHPLQAPKQLQVRPWRRIQPAVCFRQEKQQQAQAPAAAASATAAPSTPATHTGTQPGPATDNKTQQAEDVFVWTKQWYPLAIASDLDPKKPFGTKLLGKELVIWQDAQQQWRCFEDRCPHRLAPLSEGRIEPSDQTLMCSYHGWRFNGQGKAVSIPQSLSDSPQAEKTACASSRSCAKTYPTKELLDMVWVWPESGPEAYIESAATEAAMCEDMKTAKPEDISGTTSQNFVRDMPVPFHVMMENISDQSHVPFAHHGVANNRTQPWASHFKVTNVNKELVRKDGYTFDLEWSPDGINPPIAQNVKCIPPSYIEYYTPKEKGFNSLWFYCVPLDEHSTRVITHSIIAQPLPGVVKKLLALRPRWIDHLVLNEVFDGDLAYLAKAASNATEHDASFSNWAQEYYMPAQADRSVIAWRKWYHGRGRGGATKSTGAEPERPPKRLSRKALMDRYRQHTKHCPSCSKMLRRMQAWQTGLKGLAAVLGLYMAAQLGTGSLEPLSPAAAAVAAAAIASLAASSKLHDWEDKFKFRNYIHAER